MMSEWNGNKNHNQAQLRRILLNFSGFCWAFLDFCWAFLDFAGLFASFSRFYWAFWALF